MEDIYGVFEGVPEKEARYKAFSEMLKSKGWEMFDRMLASEEEKYRHLLMTQSDPNRMLEARSGLLTMTYIRNLAKTYTDRLYNELMTDVNLSNTLSPGV